MGNLTVDKSKVRILILLLHNFDEKITNDQGRSVERKTGGDNVDKNVHLPFITHPKCVIWVILYAQL